MLAGVAISRYNPLLLGLFTCEQHYAWRDWDVKVPILTFALFSSLPAAS